MALQKFRGFGKSRTSSALMLILIFCFGAWGVSGYLTGHIGNNAFSVNGKSISANEVETALRNRTAAITQMLGGKAPTPEMKKQMHLDQLVVSELVRRTVLQQAAKELHLTPSTRHLRDELATTPMFQKQGRFDGTRYQQATAQIGLTTSAYEKLLTDDLSLRLMAPLVRMAQPSATAIMPMLAAENAHYLIETFTLSPNNLPPVETPPAQALQEFYNNNQQAYTIPEKRSISVLTLSPASVSNTISIPEEQITERYNQNRNNYKQPEKRHVRHILVATAKEATELFNQVKSHEDFIRLAQAKTLDTASKAKGGDLGDIAESDVVPAFAKVAFSAQPGTVAGPVESPFGWHIIWVESINAPHIPALAEVHDQIRKELVAEQTEDTLQDLLRTIDDRTAAGDNLNAISKATGLPLTKQPLLTANSNAMEPMLLAQAFEAEPKTVTGPITMGDNTLVYLEVTTVEPSKIPPLADIKDRVQADLTSATKQNILRQQAMQLIGTARQTNNVQLSLATIAANIKPANGNIPFKGQSGAIDFTGPADAPEWLHTKMMDVYQLPVMGTLGEPLRDGENQIVVRLTRREIPTLSPEAAASAAKTYQQQLQQNAEAFILNQLVANATVSYNVGVMRRIFGADWSLPQ